MDSFAQFLTIEKLKETRTWPQIGNELGMTPEKARAIYRKYHNSSRLSTEQDNDDLAISFDFNKPGAMNWRDIIDHAERGREINDTLGGRVENATVTIDTELPIAVTFTGDWHLGDGSTDHASWKSDIASIIETPRAFLIDLGDSNQNMRSFKTLSAVLGQVLSPAQQVAVVKGVVDELSKFHKLLAKVKGNHDFEFDERIFGNAVQDYLLRSIDAPLFSNKGLLILRVGSEKTGYQEYTILIFHKSRFSSFIRPAHGAFREWQLSFPAEIVAGAHNHVPAFECFLGYSMAESTGRGFGGEVFLIKTGSYQDSEYGWKYFHNGGKQVFPTVVLYPKEHKKMIFMDMHDAHRFIGGPNGN